MNYKNDLLFEAPEEKEIQEDERFQKPLNNDFKKQIKKENNLANKEQRKRIIFEWLKKYISMNPILRMFDFLLNIFSIGAIIVSVVTTFHYFLVGEPYMTVVGCVLIFVTIYMAEKIN